MCGNTVAEVPARSDRARVVHAGGDVVLAVVTYSSLLKEGGQAGTTSSTGNAVRTIFNHLGDLTQRARRLDLTVVVAGASSIVALHETRIPYAAVGGVNAHAAVALLHDDGENVARVNARRAGDTANGGLEPSVLLVAVVFQACVEALAGTF